MKKIMKSGKKALSLLMAVLMFMGLLSLEPYASAEIQLFYINKT